jgi:hypothetical protein
VYIHYNGWPERWDEWVYSSSSRILPLHTKTFQTVLSSISGPHPATNPDASQLLTQRTTTVIPFVRDSINALDKAKTVLEQYYITEGYREAEEGKDIE